MSISFCLLYSCPWCKKGMGILSDCNSNCNQKLKSIQTEQSNQSKTPIKHCASYTQSMLIWLEASSIFPLLTDRKILLCLRLMAARLLGEWWSEEARSPEVYHQFKAECRPNQGDWMRMKLGSAYAQWNECIILVVSNGVNWRLILTMKRRLRSSQRFM